MVIEEFYATPITVYRETAGSSQSVSTTATVATTTGLIRLESDTTRIYDQREAGKTYCLYTDDSIDIKAGDIVYDSVDYYNVRESGNYLDLEDDTDSYKLSMIVKRD